LYFSFIAIPSVWIPLKADKYPTSLIMWRAGEKGVNGKSPYCPKKTVGGEFNVVLG